jgi:hypothetical protein
MSLLMLPTEVLPETDNDRHVTSPGATRAERRLSLGLVGFVLAVAFTAVIWP